MNKLVNEFLVHLISSSS